MKKILFTGSGVAIVTPFNETGVDFDKLGELIEWHIENKTDAIIICGTTGEASCMHDTEHLSCIEYAVKKTAGRIPVIAGTGSNYTAHAIELSKKAESYGVDGLLLVTPYYNKTSQHGLVKHFKAIAEATNLPIILYNVPGRTGLNMSVDTVIELSKIDNIVAMKEASGSITYVAQLVAKCPELTIYSGNDDMIVPVLSLGGKGVISVVANVLPLDTHNMCQYYLGGDVQKAKDLQLKMLEVIDSLFIEVNPVPIKTAMNLLGHKVGALRMPLCDMLDKNVDTLKKALSNYGLL